MTKNTIFLLSGQGSQYYHMGKHLYEHEKVFRFWVDTANNHIINKYGIDMLEELYNKQRNKTQTFDNILYTHPAIFTIEYALFQLLLSYNIVPNYLIGGSLGEFTALTLAGCFSFKTAIELIMEQAFFIDKYFPTAKMIAIFNDFNLFNNENILRQNTEIVSINFKNHFVICCETKIYKTILTWLEAKDILYQPVAINKAFHTSLIDVWKENFCNSLLTKQNSFYPLKIPILSCINSAKKVSVDKEYLWDIVRKPIKFFNLIKDYENTLLNEATIIDLSPSGTYATFAKYCLNSNTNIFPLLTPIGGSNQTFKNTLLKIKDSL